MQEKKTLVLLKEKRLASWINCTLSPFSSEFMFGLVLFARPKSYLHSRFSGGVKIRTSLLKGYPEHPGLDHSGIQQEMLHFESVGRWKRPGSLILLSTEPCNLESC